MLELTFLSVDLELVSKDLLYYVKSEMRYKSLDMLANIFSKSSFVLQKFTNKYQLYNIQ